MRWKSIKGFKGMYEVSTSGLIRSLKRPWVIKTKILKVGIASNGYPTVTLWDNGKLKRTETVHRLVAETFLKNPLKKGYINHKNGIKIDNRTQNLEWVTCSENQRHSIRTGLAPYPPKKIRTMIKCLICKKKFFRRRQTTKLCSRACQDINHRNFYTLRRLNRLEEKV